MEKAKILKGLECCADGDSCKKCPYDKQMFCDKNMCADAAALIKANEIPKPKYTCATIFTKKGNLHDYMCTDKVASRWPQYSPSAQYKSQCEAEREIELILLSRCENGKLYCRIKCPVNPIPVKGEFEVPTFSAIQKFLFNNGWRFKQKLYPRMFE